MTSITLTEEQYAPIHSNGRKIVVKALAGTGKSTLLRAYAHFNPSLKILYLVFNADNSAHAKKTFPTNVKVSTFHALAYETVGSRYQAAGKVKTLTPQAIKDFLNISDWKIASTIRDIINKYVYSTDTDINENHLPDNLSSFYKKQSRPLIGYAREAWKLICDLASKMPCNHDAYLKIWALGNPVLNFDTIMVDEAQDSNSMMMAIIKSQSCKLILVGDRNQQIYGFRGSVNILDNQFLRDAEIYPLTQSFRFGEPVAKVANIILSMASEKLRVRGLPQILSKVMNKDDNDPGHLGKPYQKAYISRTVSETINTALSLVEEGKKTYWGGKISSYNLDDLLDIYYLSAGQKDAIKKPYLIKDFDTFTYYKDVAEQTSDNEMLRNVKIIEQYGHNLPKHIESLKKSATEHQVEADYIVTTAHRSKGLEFECVTLSDDFVNPLSILAKSMKAHGHVTEQMRRDFLSEMFLLYVAVTRAIYRLNLNTAVKDLIEDAKRKLADKR